MPPAPPRTPDLAAAETAVIAQLRDRQFEAASRTVAAYEAQQPTPRGIGVDWANHDTFGDVAALEAIFSHPVDTPEQVRIAAGLAYLWGTGKPRRRWIPREAMADDTVRILVLHAYRQCQLAYDERAHRLFRIPTPHRSN